MSALERSADICFAHLLTHPSLLMLKLRQSLYGLHRREERGVEDVWGVFYAT